MVQSDSEVWEAEDDVKPLAQVPHIDLMLDAGAPRT